MKRLTMLRTTDPTVLLLVGTLASATLAAFGTTAAANAANAANAATGANAADPPPSEGSVKQPTEAPRTRLGIGDPAPPIAASEWLRGDPVTEFVAGRVYVMEFWASWCVPCVAGMPHLSALQQRHAGDVTIIGMNIWEDPAEAATWMAEQPPELMAYTVALQAGTAMEDRWMAAAGQDGIPAAFIVDRAGVIAWIGHPNAMGEPLQRIVDGQWDVAAFKATFASEADIERRRRAAMAEFEAMAKTEIEAYMAATEAGDLDALARTATALIGLRPPAAIAENLFGVGVHRMITGGRARLAVDFIRENQRVIGDDAVALFNYARSIIYNDLFDGARDARLAIELLERACELTDSADSTALDLLARAYVLRAIEIQQLAVERASDDARAVREQHRAAYERVLPGEGAR